ncbi:MAG: bifunctional hydroxymethylpyrimidine kinase/phosphomethylpyrimidine kinase [Prevotella sp.]|nr:bifunctional hydroxymethylpyrimidine kinase/phosphomethylpyrimidine kinase [Prevotella sp.]
MKNKESAGAIPATGSDNAATAAADSSFFTLHSSLKSYLPVLTIAGSDSSGGAGIQADIKTISALGCYAASAITSITVQNTLGVTAVQAVQPDIVAGQIRAVMDDIHPRAVKIGMVNDADTIYAIADALSQYDLDGLVVDPVMVSTSGSRLMQEDAIGVFCTRLLPMATLLTPNVPEAEVLAGMKITSCDDMDIAAGRILKKGCEAVLIKGGHLAGRKTDRLYRVVDENRFVEGSSAVDEYRVVDGGLMMYEFACDNVPTRNTHGTGCTLSAAIASYLAFGCPAGDAIALAKDYLTEALQAGADVEIGSGHGPVNHFFDPKKLIKI